MMNIVTKKEFQWVCDVVDNHKRIRSESTKDRVKILMLAAMNKILERATKQKKKTKFKLFDDTLPLYSIKHPKKQNEKRRKLSKRNN